MDWKREIVIMVLVKQELAERDAAGLWPYHLPALGASMSDIDRTESCLGFALDADYAAFLQHANGWRGFVQDIDLFGTPDLCGSQKMLVACSLIEKIRQPLMRSGFNSQDVLPIAMGLNRMDLVVMIKPGHPAAGTVIWFAEAEVERYKNFVDYYLTAVDYNRKEIASQ